MGRFVIIAGIGERGEVRYPELMQTNDIWSTGSFAL